ncbi:MAG: PP2C family protein-serine/threonine phosphatase [Bacteroidota bacterium]
MGARNKPFSRGRENAYNTTDPSKLLELKRLEADALLDVLRTINQEDLKIDSLCRIAKYVLLGQLGVHKMAFFYEAGDNWEEGLRQGFTPLGLEAMQEMFAFQSEITPVSEETTPQLAAHKVEYIVPITHRDHARAFFLIADFADSEVEAQNDLIFIETLGNILSVAIQNKQLFQEKMAQEFLRKELEVAGTIQKQMLLSDFSRFKEIDVYGLNMAHHGVGGDFFDVIKKGKGKTFICIADVSGKGIGAALLMSNLQANLRALCAQYDDPEAIVHELNHILYRITQGEKFVTLFLALVDTETGKLQYVNAGHDYPILIHQGAIQLLESGCTFLGLLPDLPIVSTAVEFSPSDVLFMYTDGLPDQRDDNGHMFGSDSIPELLKSLYSRDAKGIVAGVQAALHAHAGVQPADDDITLLSVKFLE